MLYNKGIKNLAELKSVFVDKHKGRFSSQIIFRRKIEFFRKCFLKMGLIILSLFL